MATQKLLSTLSINSLKVEFPVYRTKEGVVNQLAKAIEEGVLTERLEESGRLMHGGDIQGAVKAMKACLASYKVNYKKAIANGSAMDVKIEEERVSTLEDFLNSFGKGKSGTTKLVVSEAPNTAKWDLSIEQIEKYAGDHQMLQSIYDCISSKISKSFGGNTNEAFEASSALQEKRDYVRGLMKNRKEVSKPVLDAKLVEKLSKGKATTLSKAEIAAIVKLLS